MTVGSYMEPTPQWRREQPKLSLLPASHCPFPGHTSVCGILVSGTSPDNPRKVGEFLLGKKNHLDFTESLCTEQKPRDRCVEN